jgi:hypothetical protein
MKSCKALSLSPFFLFFFFFAVFLVLVFVVLLLFATILLFFLLFINDRNYCATKENAFFQIDSCPVNDNDPLFDDDGQGQQATL